MSAPEPRRRPSGKRRWEWRAFLAIWLATVVAGCVLLPTAFALDDRVDDAFAAAPPWVRTVGGGIGAHGDWGWHMGAGLVLLGIAFLLRSRKLQRVFFCALLASCLGGLIAAVSKSLAGRTRPGVHEPPAGFYGPRHEGDWTFRRVRFGSFPSAHAATSVGFVAVLVLAGGRLAVAGAILAPVVPIARMMSRSHHLSDVWAGSLVGVVAAAFLWYVAYPRLRALTRRSKRRREERRAPASPVSLPTRT